MASVRTVPKLGYFLVFLLLIIFVLSNGPYVEAFAAKKKGGGVGGKQNKNTATTKKGFGAPPPSLEDVLTKFPNRMPANNPLQVECPCGTTPGSMYGDCCAPLHDGTKECTTMTDVLKSRFSAFCWRNVKHVMGTTHPNCRDYQNNKIAWAKDLNKLGMFDSFEFVKLEAGPEEAGETKNEGFIEFQVTMRGRDDDDEDATTTTTRRSAASVAGQETVVKERSKFLRDPSTGVWTYASGDVRSEIAGLEDTQLNV